MNRQKNTLQSQLVYFLKHPPALILKDFPFVYGSFGKLFCDNCSVVDSLCLIDFWLKHLACASLNCYFCLKVLSDYSVFKPHLQS